MTLENKTYNKILKTNYFKIGMIVSFTAIISFLIWDQNESFAAIIFSEDFSSYVTQAEIDASWKSSDTVSPGFARGNIIVDVINFEAITDTTNDKIAFDLQNAGVTISDSNFVLRFKLNYSALSANDPFGGSIHSIGLSDGDQTVSDRDAQDFIGMQMFASTNRPVYAVDVNNAALPTAAGDNSFDSNISIGTPVYVEIERINATNYSVEWFSNSDFTGSIGEADGTTSSSVQNLRYVVWNNVKSNLFGPGQAAGIIDDIVIFENTFVAPPSPPTIKITKDTTNGDGSFNFTIFNATNPANSTALNIPDTSINNMTAPLTVQAGSYSVIETVPLNWNLISSDCLINGIPQGSTLNFNIINGDTVECIFENTFSPISETCNGLTATIVGTAGDEFLIGTPGDDVIVGLGGNDIINGKGGNDTICGGDGNDLIFGGPGDDLILGEAGEDLIFGNSGDDSLKGNQGDDRVIGGSGDDAIEGNEGDDMLIGDSGDDSLDGGANDDFCEVSSGEVDTLTNCENP